MTTQFHNFFDGNMEAVKYFALDQALKKEIVSETILF